MPLRGLRLSEDLKTRLEQVQKRRGYRSVNAFILEAVEEKLQRADAQGPVDIALAKVNRKRCAHEDGIEILAADQPGVLHATIRRIHRGKQACRPEKLQRIDKEIERGRHHDDEPARAEKPEQIVARGVHEMILSENPFPLSRIML